MKVKFLAPAVAIINGMTGLWLIFSAGTASAEERLLAPQVIIQRTSDTLQQSLQDRALRSDIVKVTQFVEEVIEPNIDFDRVSALVLGKYWKSASADQKSRFKQAFRGLLVRTYATAFTEYAEWKIEYLPLKMEPGAKKVVVKTKILQPGREPIPVDYRMAPLGGGWKVYDVLIGGVSLVTNYRNSFRNEVARTGSLDSIIERIAQRNSEALRSAEKAS